MQQRYVMGLPANKITKDIEWLLTADQATIEKNIWDKYGTYVPVTPDEVDKLVTQITDTFGELEP